MSVTKRSPRLSRRDRRKQLLVVAGEVFVRCGYRRAGVDEICRRAGVSKPLLYNHFPSKLGLYLAVLENTVDTLVFDIRHALHSTTDSCERLHAGVQAYFDFIDRHPHGLQLVFGSDVRSEPEASRLVRYATEACVDAVFDVVASDSEHDRRQARLVAVGVVGASQVAARHWLEAGRPIPKNEAVDAVVDLCWKGVSQVPLRSIGVR